MEQETEGRSRALEEVSSPGSKDTDALLGSIIYVGGMNYAKYRLEDANRPKDFVKHKMVRPPTLCMRNEMGGDNARPARGGSASAASSRRSSLYQAAEEAAAARTDMLEAEADTKCALERLADTRVERIVRSSTTRSLMKLRQCQM